MKIQKIPKSRNIKLLLSWALLLCNFAFAFAQTDILPNQNNADTSKQLDEVVVTALGVKRSKKSLGYSTQEVGVENVQLSRENNFLNALSGEAAGVAIRRNNGMGSSTNILIRGVKSLSSNNQALIVVDGVPLSNNNSNTLGQVNGAGGYDYGNAISDIDPSTIESINILKGAAATALYGSRASNGVVLIATKKGTKPRGIGVSVSSSYTVGYIDESTFPKYQTKYGGGYRKYYGTPKGYFRQTTVNGQTVNYVPLTADASWGAPFDNSQVATWSTFVPESPNYNKLSTYQAAKNGPLYFFKPSNTFTNTVGLEGSGDKGSFKLNYTNVSQTGILPNSTLNKNNLSFNASHNITSKLTASASFNYVNQNTVGRYTTGYSDNIMSSFRQWFQTNVDLKELEDIYNATKKNYSWNPTSPKDLTPIYWDNPYFSRYKNYSSDTRDRYFGNAMISWRALDWLSVTGRFGFDAFNQYQEERIAVTSNPVPRYSTYSIARNEFNYDLLVNINKEWNDFDLTGLVGVNLRRELYRDIAQSTTGGLLFKTSPYALGSSKSPLAAPSIDNDYGRNVDGYFANASIGFRKMIYLEASARMDISSTLPAANNSYFYPSVSATFIFSELLKDQTWLDFGKLRVNYAQVGNDAPIARLTDEFTANYSAANAIYTPLFAGSVPLQSPSRTKNNPNLKPELTTNFEVGLEAMFFKRRLAFDIGYYNSSTKNQIFGAEISRVAGYSFQYVNAGEVTNKGVELSVTGVPIRTKDFEWTIKINWAKNQNEVVSLQEGVTSYQIGSFQGGISQNAIVGKPYGVIMGSNFVYDKQGRKLVDTAGYYLQSSSAEEIGNINPNWTGGIRNSLRYKNFQLSFLIDVQSGGNLFSLDMYYGLSTGLYEETAGNNDLGKPVRNSLEDGGGLIVQGVLADGKPNTKRVSLEDYGYYGNEYNPAAAFIYDASYVKLRDISLSYRMSFQKVVQTMNVTLSARNLWIIYKNLPYADPEDAVGSGNVGNGYQSGVYPAVREIALTLNVTF